MWIGVARMREQAPGSKLFGVTLVFATIPIMRIVFNVLHANDELWVIRHLFGDSQAAFWLIFFVVGIVLENMITKQHLLAETLWGKSLAPLQWREAFSFSRAI
jgi:hypothetical protein